VSCDDAELEALAAAAVHASARQGGYADLFTRFDLSEAIDRAIAELPDVFRDVVLLIDVNDQSYETAALTLGVPIGTVRSRLFRARRLLQEALIAHARDAGLVRPPIEAGRAEEGQR
jgi:RNA polymerase sigma-70 factor (ECF subfamily)